MKKVLGKLKKIIIRNKMLLKIAVLMIGVCVLIISGFLVAVNNIYRTSNVEREIIENEAITSRIVTEMDQSIYDINDISLSIYSNQRINSSILELYGGEYSDIFRKYQLKELIAEQMLTYLDANETVSCCQIYISNQKEPITVGNFSAWQISEISQEYQKTCKDKVFETGGELQMFPLDCGKIIFTRALGDFNSGKKNDEYIYSIVLVLSDTYIGKLMDKLYYSNYSHGKMICILNDEGRIVYSTNKDRIGTKVSELGISGLPVGAEPVTFETKESIYSIEYDRKLQHYVMVATELKEIALYAETFRVSTMTIILTIGLALLIVIFVLTTVLGSPVQDLINSIKRIGVDRDSVKLVDIGDGGDIAISFNEAISRVEHIIDAQYQNEIKLKNARIAILQEQINPHFIFNTLETISWSVYRENKEESIKMITNLGKILRYTTYNYTKYVRLIDEIRIIERYLYFEQIRHGGFKAIISVDPELENFRIPCLLLQPIVENACHHGIRNKENGRILIRARRTDDFAEIIIADNGIGMPQEQIDMLMQSGVIREEDDEHIGVINVKERVYSAFGENASFELSSVQGR
ncbi:MAG: histidine kinase, partial [Christensenellaceae bacterium]|nr:histidine kinase [Christensenellaceae bacterium]